MTKGLLSLLLVAGAVAQMAGNDTWSVMTSHIMTISMGLDFMSSTTGVVAGSQNGLGPEIKRTTDAGKTWTDVYHEQALLMYMCVAFSGTQQGVTAGLGLNRWEASSAYTLDGGQSWQLTDDRNLLAVYQDCEPVAAVPGMIVMPGDWENIIGSSGEGVAISFNGGKDFTHHKWTVDTEARYASFATTSVGWISGGSWPDTDNVANSVIRRSMYVDIVKDAEGQLSARLLTRQTKPRADIPGFIGVVAKTPDGGKTWEVQFNDTGRLYCNGIFAVDANNVWFVAEGDEGAWIFNTNDGGSTWNQQLFVSGASMLTVKMFDLNEGWAAGAASLSEVGGFNAGMWHTVDGGKTWSLMTIKSYYVNDLDLLDRDHVYATAFSVLGDSAVLQYIPSQ